MALQFVIPTITSPMNRVFHPLLVTFRRYPTTYELVLCVVSTLPMINETCPGTLVYTISDTHSQAVQSS